MDNKQSSYRQIMKATSLLGGVQVFNIIINVIRSKFVAVLLGPSGMGVMGLLNSTTRLVSAFTNFGLGTSAVKDIAAANATGNINRIAIVVGVFRRLVWITGTLGALVVLGLSPWLSQYTFGNKNYTFAFIYISVTLLLNQLSSGQMVVLQGMRQLKYLAKANISGAAIGLIATVPLYYFFGEEGIVPAIIIASIASLIRSWYYANKIKLPEARISGKQTLDIGKGMLTMGFLLSLSGLIGALCAYFVRIYISNRGSIADVGLFTSGFAIINSYVGMIFTAMSTDYFPRLSAVADNNKMAKKTINQQAEMSILILTPILLVFIVFIKWVIILLYSYKFEPIQGMIQWAAIGILFKAADWAIGYILLAKSASKLYIQLALLSEAYFLTLNILGYKYGGLEGLGISYMIGYVISMIQMYIVAAWKFEFHYDKVFFRLFITQLFLILACFIVMRFINQPFSYFAGSVFILGSFYYSYKELDKRMDLKSIIISLKNKYNGGK